MTAVFLVKRFLQLTAFIAALVLAACGGDGGSVAPAPTPVAPPQPVAPPPPTPALPVTVSFSPQAVALFEGKAPRLRSGIRCAILPRRGNSHSRCSATRPATTTSS